MKLIQFILLAALAFILISNLRRLRSAVIDKLIILVIIIAGMIFVIFPDLTNRIAAYLGIGRGADLVFYLAIVGLGYVVLILYAKIRKLENQIIQIIRNEALGAFKNNQDKQP
jgi:small membrane protein